MNRVLQSCTVMLMLVGGLAIGGCGPDTSNLPKTVPASGTITLDGKPVDGAQVVFIDETSNKSASGMTDANGKFSVDAFPQQKKGAQPGTYKVQVSKTIENKTGQTNADGGEVTEWKFGLPSKYSSFMKSGLTATVADAGSTDIKLELSSK